MISTILHIITPPSRLTSNMVPMLCLIYRVFVQFYHSASLWVGFAQIFPEWRTWSKSRIIMRGKSDQIDLECLSYISYTQ
jgi:hypothetical protein